MEFVGDFETHITVQCHEGGGVEALRLWAEGRGLKFHHIVLERGRYASQPMLTRPGRGRLSDERKAAAQIGIELGTAGLGVIRVKIEAAPWNEGVPQTSRDATNQPCDRYFEHHVKLLLAPDADLSTLSEAHSAHLSRNARRVRGDGLRERFLTQRFHSLGRVEARERLNALVEATRTAGYPILKVEEEYVVYDSNLAIDAGWLSPGS